MADSSSSIPRIADTEEAPLSPGQERMWFLQEFGELSYAYNSPMTYVIRGPLDRGLLERTLRELVARHEVLRTRFRRAEPHPVQIIDPVPGRVEVSWEQVATVEEGMERVKEEGRARVDLENGPVFRPCVFEVGEGGQEYLLLLAMHHASFDGWSERLLREEFLALYENLRTGCPCPRNEPPLRYRDYAAWQRGLLRDPEIRERVLGYWKERLDGELPVLRLPLDHPRPARVTSRGRIVGFTVPAELAADLSRVGMQEKTTLFSVFLAAYFAFLNRYTGQEDVIVGVPSFGRRRMELEPIVGLFVTTLPVRVRVRPGGPWRDLLRDVRVALLEAMMHDEISFEQMLTSLRVARDPSVTPVFQTLFHMLDLDEAPEAPGVLRMDRKSVSLGSSQVDLAILINRRKSEPEFRVQFNPDLFEERSVRRWIGHFENLLRAVAEDPSVPVQALPLLGEEERRQIVYGWNRTQRDAGVFRDVPARVAEVARRTPDRPAISWRGRVWTYAELDGLASAVAARLRDDPDVPLRAEEPVAVLMERCPAMVAALLGILRAGGAYLPFDPAYPGARMAFMLEDTAARRVLTTASLRGRLPSTSARVWELDEVWAGLEPRPDESFPALDPTRLAYVLYTSGSTGNPKGVLVEHGNVGNFVDQHLEMVRLESADRVAMLSTLTFDISVEELWPTLCRGACVCLCDEETKLSPPRLLDWFASERITVSHLPTPLTEVLLAEPWPAGHSLRVLLTGGDRLHRFPAAALPYRFINTYGPTECTVTATACDVPGGEGREGAPPIGRPVANVRAYILDSARSPVPPGVTGELYLAGRSLARGYLKRPEETARRFVEDPFTPGERMYATGDLARFSEDGSIAFLGRCDDQVQIRGHRVEPGEIQHVLADHPAVREAVVLHRTDTRGEGRLTAYVQTAGAGAEAAELEAFLRTRLPDYMIPGAWLFLSEWPRTPGGKIDRSALPVPEAPGKRLGRGALPESATERELAEIWQGLLGRTPSIDDDFFDAGGESLKAMQLVSRIRQRWPLDFTVRTVFAYPTIRGLAEQIDLQTCGQVEVFEEGVL